MSDTSFDRNLACSIAPALRMLYSSDGMAVAVFCTNKQVQKLASTLPEHMFITHDCDLANAFSAFEKMAGDKPKIVVVQGLGFFALGKNKEEAEHARLSFLDEVKRETESGHVGSSKDSFARGRLEGRIALVTGGAQGFGKGLAESMAAEGAYVIIADLNQEGAESCASEINMKYGSYKAIAVEADVTNADSVEFMVQEAVLAFGGLDILLSNAGVVVAGSLDEMTEKGFDFVTSVNYKGYFLCTKYASKPMIIQHMYSPDYLTDIIEINSKSGLEGSNKNFAYSGSKFGGIGLTQSFAKELVEHGIKVNAICPGNLLDGPLWSDPSTGLFKQYFDSGKVPGAKSVADVRKHYENMVPMKRGCTVEDVARAIFYIVEQKYETGQAIAVTGGQVMLK